MAVLAGLVPGAAAQPAPATRDCFGLESIFPSFANNINLLGSDLTQVEDAMQAALTSGLAASVNFLPTPTGGGFTYKFDPNLGVFARTTDSFGPVFADRYETTGRGKFTFTASYSRFTFDDADGVSMRNGELTAVQFAGCAPMSSRFSPAQAVATPFLDLFSVREEVEADVFSLGVVYGVTDALDVGITVPILRVKVRESVRNRASGSTNRRMSQGQATRSTFGRARVTHFMTTSSSSADPGPGPFAPAPRVAGRRGRARRSTGRRRS